MSKFAGAKRAAVGNTVVKFSAAPRERDGPMPSVLPDEVFTPLENPQENRNAVIPTQP